MFSTHRTSLGILALVAAAAVVTPVRAQQPYAEHAPTAKDPLRFSAFAIQMNSGMSGDVEVAIERWSTAAERQSLIALVNTATDKSGGQDKLLKGLQDIPTRTGFIRTPNSLGWDLKYAFEGKLPDGTRQIVIATDKPVGFLAVVADATTLDYPFSLVEMQFPQGKNTGEGKLLAQTSVSTKDGKLQLGLYGQEAVRLSTITEHKDKK
jgi:hypothetical protein